MLEDSRAVSLNTARKTKLNKTMYNYMPDRNSIKRKVKKKKKAFIYSVAKRINHIPTLNTGNL